MREEVITIGGKTFEVACQPGEEHYLQAAAKLLDSEARTLLEQIGRLPETRMLLMAGLMLADKTAGFEDRARQAEEELEQARAEIERLRAQGPTRVPVAVIPQDAVDSMANLAARAEALADQIDDQRR
jgi:cell division protein ZapA